MYFLPGPLIPTGRARLNASSWPTARAETPAGAGSTARDADGPQLAASQTTPWGSGGQSFSHR